MELKDVVAVTLTGAFCMVVRVIEKEQKVIPRLF